jgi:hypothetical protein
MFHVRIVFLALLLMLLASPRAQATTILIANLTHDQEPGAGPLTTSTGGPRPLSFGTATFVLNDAMTELSMSVTVFNIDVTGTQTADTFDNLLNAHIHCCAPPGTNAGVRWGFLGAPDNDNNPDNLVVTPFATGVGGTFTSIWNQPEGNAGTTLTTNLPGILAGQSYINFHTVQFTGGEIRGQIEVVPEPSTMLLIGSGLAGAIARRRRR